MDAYSAFGLLAERLDSPTLISGRRCFQADAEANVARSVASALRLEKDHRLLEIGCGVGVLLTPLSEYVAEAVGIDHPACLEKYRAFGVPANVRLAPGRWPEDRPDGLFDRILIYSVLQYLSGADGARSFVRAAIDSLRPGGLLLVGDIPNASARQRFLSTDYGRSFAAEWAAQNADAQEGHETCDSIFSQVDSAPVFLDDDFILGLLADTRRDGFESYLLLQPTDLPFSHTREDLLISKRD